MEVWKLHAFEKKKKKMLKDLSVTMPLSGGITVVIKCIHENLLVTQMQSL